MEAIMVRHKDGICRNVTTTALGSGRYKRSTNVYKSIAHYVQNGSTLHCCENELESTDLFTRKLPSPFDNMLLFGDVLFVLENSRQEMMNFGLNDFRLFMENQHPQLSPGHVIRPNLCQKTSAVSIDETEEDEATTQEATTGTFITNETSEEEEEEEEEIESDDNLDD